jgi:hypothetical protein
MINRPMQPLILNLRPESFDRFNKFFVPSALVFAVATIILGFMDESGIRWTSVVMGLVIIVQAIINWRNVRSLISTWDEWGIRGRITPGKPASIAWKDVASIEASMFALDLHLKNQSTVHVDLSCTTFQQHKDLKPRILNLARAQGVEVKGA